MILPTRASLCVSEEVHEKLKRVKADLKKATEEAYRDPAKAVEAM